MSASSSSVEVHSRPVISIANGDNLSPADDCTSGEDSIISSEILPSDTSYMTDCLESPIKDPQLNCSFDEVMSVIEQKIATSAEVIRDKQDVQRMGKCVLPPSKPDSISTRASFASLSSDSTADYMGEPVSAADEDVVSDIESSRGSKRALMSSSKRHAYNPSASEMAANHANADLDSSKKRRRSSSVNSHLEKLKLDSKSTEVLQTVFAPSSSSSSTSSSSSSSSTPSSSSFSGVRRERAIAIRNSSSASSSSSNDHAVGVDSSSSSSSKRFAESGETFGSILLFLIKTSHARRNAIDDREMEKSESCFIKLLRAHPDTYEALFGLARLRIFDANFKDAVDLLNRAIHLRPHDPLFHMWLGHAYLMQSAEETGRLKNRTLLQAEKCYEQCLSLDDGNVEALWGLLEISFDPPTEFWYGNPKRRSPQDWAIYIKEIDDYVGYLAWAEAFLRGPDMDQWKGELILHELTDRLSHRTEAYIRLWNLYYHRGSFEKSLEVAERAYIKATVTEDALHKNVLNMMYVKSLFSCERFLACFSILKQEYGRTNMPLYLYQLGRLKCKTMSPVYFKEALVDLQSCLTTLSQHSAATSSSSLAVSSPLALRQACTNYWLGSLYRRAEDHIKAYVCLQDSYSALVGTVYSTTEISKLNMMKAYLSSMSGAMSRLRSVQDLLDVAVLQKEQPPKKHIIKQAKENTQIIRSVVDPYLGDILLARIRFELEGDISGALELLVACHLRDESRLEPVLLLWSVYKAETDTTKMLETAQLAMDILRDRQDSIPRLQADLVKLLFAKSLFKAQQRTRAISFLENEWALSSGDGNPIILYHIGRLTAKSQMNADRGIEALKELIERYSLEEERKGRAQYWLGTMYRQQADTHNAIKMFHFALPRLHLQKVRNHDKLREMESYLATIRLNTLRKRHVNRPNTADILEEITSN